MRKASRLSPDAAYHAATAVFSLSRRVSLGVGPSAALVSGYVQDDAVRHVIDALAGVGTTEQLVCCRRSIRVRGVVLRGGAGAEPAMRLTPLVYPVIVDGHETSLEISVHGPARDSKGARMFPGQVGLRRQARPEALLPDFSKGQAPDRPLLVPWRGSPFKTALEGCRP